MFQPAFEVAPKSNISPKIPCSYCTAAKGVTTPIYHVVFHMFVLIAATVHWFMIYYYVIPLDLGMLAGGSCGEDRGEDTDKWQHDNRDIRRR